MAGAEQQKNGSTYSFWRAYSDAGARQAGASVNARRQERGKNLRWGRCAAVASKCLASDDTSDKDYQMDYVNHIWIEEGRRATQTGSRDLERKLNKKKGS